MMSSLLERVVAVVMMPQWSDAVAANDHSPTATSQHTLFNSKTSVCTHTHSPSSRHRHATIFLPFISSMYGSSARLSLCNLFCVADCKAQRLYLQLRPNLYDYPSSHGERIFHQRACRALRQERHPRPDLAESNCGARCRLRYKKLKHDLRLRKERRKLHL